MLPLFASVSVCLPPLPSPSLSFPCYSLPLTLPPSPSLSPSLSLFQSPIPRPPHLFSLFSFLLFLSLRLSVFERESVCGRGRDRHRDTERVRYRKSERDMPCL